MKTLQEITDYAEKCHSGVNQMYDGKPYFEAHVLRVAHTGAMFVTEYYHYLTRDVREEIIAACLCHDILEDTLESYNDLMKAVDSKEVAEMVYAVTNEKGRNRKERARDSYYDGIRNVEFATLVKLADRYANLSYSKKTGSRMFKMYRKEHDEFITKVVGDAHEFYSPIVKELDALFD